MLNLRGGMLMSRRSKAGCAGFTLIELMVVVAIIGISLSIAIPQLSSISQNATLGAAARELYGQLQRAKMDAIKRNETVAIAISSSNPYSYTVFVDSLSNRQFDDGEDLLAKGRLPKWIVFDNISFPGGVTSFTSQGRPGGDFGGVDLRDSRSGNAIRLTTTLAGYVHLAKK